MTAVPFRVKALFEYSSTHEDDLKFSEGQIITVTEEEDDDWYCGEYIDGAGTKQEGLFPRNFVEKYEPTAPPRPTRTRTKKEVEPVTAAPEPTVSALPLTEEPSPVHATEPDVDEAAAASPPSLPPEPVPPAAPVPTPAKPAEPLPSPTPVPPVPKQSESSPATSPPVAKAAPVAKPGGPPPVSEKPTSSSFRDRIAAFNKPAAAPITPFKPSGLGGGAGFVKKPFVAPPPARNAYVPPPQSVPTAKVYRREEDPEIKEREAENFENAERAGLVATGSHDGGEDDQPKPTSLKERIALLQKQQMESASRQAEAVAKKEKPKKPPKKRAEGHEASEIGAEPEDVPVAGYEEEAGGKRSIESARSPVPRRKSSSKPQESFGDGNDADMSGAGDTTEGQEDLTEGAESDERSRHPSHAPTGTEAQEEEEGEEEEDDEEGGEEDTEARRKEELRARMAKMSGGMGMHGMFGPPGMMPMAGTAPPKKKKPPPPEKHSADDGEDARGAPPVPMMMALPGMSVPRQSEETEPAEGDELERTTRAPPPPPPARPAEDDEEEDEEPDVPRIPNVPSREPAGPPPIPGGRPAPPPVPAEARSPRHPPPPPATMKSPSAGSESDDELSERNQDPNLETPRADVPPGLRSPPPLPQSIPSPGMPSRPVLPTAASQPQEDSSPTSPASKRSSRPPPPIPGAAPAIPPAQTRPPPPPPPTASVSRQSTADTRILSPAQPSARDDEEDEEITEYEGDYDTDIASSVPHKDALKSHARESSFENTTPIRSPTAASPPSIPPPIPTAAPRAVPPPIPSQPPPDKRRSVDQPRAAPPPPPMPPPKETSQYGDDEYDPYNYSIPKQSNTGPGGHSQKTPIIDEGAYFPEASLAHSTSHERRGAPLGRPGQSGQSFDFNMAANANRTSGDTGAGRPSMESGFIANDLDLAKQSGWWRQSSQVPPVLQGRRDVYFESEESTSTNRGAKTIVTRTIYVLFRDYSQTVLTVRFDPYEPSDVQLEQRHEPPPRALRQDQLEESYDRFGRQIAEAVASKKDSVVGDGSPQGLVHDLLRPFRDALAPVGTRAFGALVYSNMANSSTQQFDEIRAGDIISIRNAKFQGKHGAMHAKYSVEVGKPDHAAIVAEWDGTKKKVRAWEQGRESRKVKLESFKLDDLRSGEVRVWRVMPRSWVGWNTQP